MPSLGDLVNSFTGGTQRRAAQNATAAATSALNTGRDAAIGQIQNNKGNWWQPMQIGYDTQQSAVNVGTDQANQIMRNVGGIANQGAQNQGSILSQLYNQGSQITDQSAGNRQGYLGGGYGSALGAQNTSGQIAQNQILRGSNQAGQALNQGAMGQQNALAGAFNLARQDTGQGYTDARGAINQQYGRAENAIGQGTQTALNYLNPLQTAGTAANDLYFGALGARGADAQRQAFETYQGANSPREQLIAQTTARLMNRNGMHNSAAHELALNRALIENQNTWMSQLAQAAGQGGQYGVQAANFAQQGGRDLGNFAAQRGQAESGLYTGEAGMLAPAAYQYGRDAANVEGQTGQLQAQRLMDTGNRIAANTLGTGDDTARLYEGLGTQQSAVEGQRGTTQANNILDLAQRQAAIEAARTGALGAAETNIGNNYLNRANQISQLAGQRYGTEAANNRLDDQTIAQLLYGNAQQNAGLQTQLGGQLIGAANQGVGNITNLAAMIGSAAMGMPPMQIPLGGATGKR